mgnify:CR=1 FL=1
MEREYQHNLEVNRCQTDENGILKLSELFLFYQDIAGEHAAKLGRGYDVLLKKNLFFAITHSRSDILRLPAAGEKLVLKTCLGKVPHLFFPRYYMLCTEGGELLAKAATRWVLMDIEKRVAAAPGDEMTYFEGEKNPWQLTEAGPVRPAETQKKVSFTVTKDYLDVNNHMNNTRYFDMAQSFVMDELRGLTPVSAAVEYRNELLEGQTMEVSIGCAENVETGEKTFYFEGNMPEKSIFRMKLVYQ